MKKIYLIVCIIVALLFSNNTNAQQLKILNQSKSSLSLELTIDNYKIKEIIDGDEVFHEIALSSIMIPNDKGKPNLPSVNRFVALPQGGKANVIVESYEKEILKNINIAPSKGIVSEYELTDEHFSKDRNIYSKNELYPNNIVSLTEQMNLRGVDAVGLSIAPVQFNPVSKELIIHKKINIRVEFEGGNGMFGDDRLRSMHWDPILQHNVLNYNSLPEINYSERFQQWITDDAEGAEYLIIIPDDESFREQAQRLAYYRSKQGIITKVYSLKDMDTYSPEDIKEWFTNAYNNWEIAPVAVCLLGDYNKDNYIGITSFVFDFNEDETYISDRPYSDINDDFLPDIAFSRLSAETAEEARIMVDKQIDYEFNNPVMDNDFYKRPIMTCAYQQTKWFQICTESINGFLNSKGKEPSRISKIYHYDGNYSDSIWSTANNTEQILNYFGPDGLNYIPATPGELEGFLAPDYENYDDTIVRNTINQNPGYILMNRDHGWYSFWDCPMFESKNVPTLTNHGKLPFVLSINCASGAFNHVDCLAKAFMKAENTGGVGVIAATYETHTYTNDSYTWGLWDFFENDFLPDYGTNTENNGDYMPAFANVSAKHFLYQLNFPNTYQNTRELTSNLFHSHCDAFLKLYSEVPQQMNIEHDNSYYSENKSFNIKAPAGSIIGISTEDYDGIKTLTIAEGTGSMQNINIPTNINPENNLHITVTKTNHLRYEQSIEIKTDNAFVTMEDFFFDDNQHNLIFNKDTYLNLKLKNTGTKDASTINMSLISDSDKITITGNNNVIEGIDNDDTIDVSEAFHIKINDIIENNTKIVFTLTIEHDGISHKENFSVIVDAPSFEIVNRETIEIGNNADNIYETGENITFRIEIKNTGNIASEPAIAKLTCNDNYINIINENIEFGVVDTNASAYLEFNAIINPEAQNKEYSNVTININSETYNFTEDTYCNLCIVIDDFENGIVDNNIWDYNPNLPWTALHNTEAVGDYCIYQVIPNNNYSTLLYIDYDFPFDGILSFRYKDESAENLRFQIDDESIELNIMNSEWNTFETDIDAGQHSLRWFTNIDYFSNNQFSYIDYITFRPGNVNVNELTSDDNIRIYPNPAEETVKLSAIGLQLSTVRIYNYLGTLVEEIEACSNEMEIDVSNYNPGLYLFNIESENKIISKKIVIK